MVDEDVVARVASLFGAKSYFSRDPSGFGKQTQYGVDIAGQRAVDLMLRLLPYMASRRSKKINEIVEAWNNRPSNNGWATRRERYGPSGIR